MKQGRRKIYITGGIVTGLLIVSCTLFAIQMSKRESETCELLEKAPRGDVVNLKNISNKNLTVLANLVGYLKYNPEHLPATRTNDKLFLPFNLKTVDLRVGWVDFVADCVKFNFAITNATTPESFEIKSIYVTTRQPFSRNFKYFCYIQPHNIFFYKSYRYACHQTIRYPCMQIYKDRDGNEQSKTVAWFVVDNLEIELDGSDKDYSRGKFSKDEHLCQWELRDFTPE